MLMMRSAVHIILCRVRDAASPNPDSAAPGPDTPCSARGIWGDVCLLQAPEVMLLCSLGQGAGVGCPGEAFHNVDAEDHSLQWLSVPINEGDVVSPCEEGMISISVSPSERGVASASVSVSVASVPQSH